MALGITSTGKPSVTGQEISSVCSGQWSLVSLATFIILVTNLVKIPNHRFWTDFAILREILACFRTQVTI